MRSDMEATLQETQKLRASVERLEGTSGSLDQKLKEVTEIAKRAEAKLQELTTCTQLMQDNITKLEESLAQADAKIRSFATVEKKFGIMEVTIQEALAKLEQKADISSLRAVAAKVDPATDDDDD